MRAWGALIAAICCSAALAAAPDLAGVQQQLQAYYAANPIGGGWDVTSIEVVRSAVVVTVTMPARQLRGFLASDPLNADGPLRANTCAMVADPKLWEMLGLGQLRYEFTAAGEPQRFTVICHAPLK